MKVIGLIGYTNKYGFAINLAKTLICMNKSVLIVDATGDKKIKSVIPTLETNSNAYVTQYNNIDFAVGFDSMYDVENYMCDQGINLGLYDFILIDIDSPKTYEFFRTRGIDKSYFFIETNVLAVNKNKEIIKAIKVYNPDENATNLTKIIFRDYMSRVAEDYFEKQVETYEVKWADVDYEMFLDERDKIEDTDSQFSGIIELKKHSAQYLNILSEISASIIEDVTYKEVLKQIKRRRG